MRKWFERKRFSAFEERLRADRPQPSSSFENEIAGRVAPRPRALGRRLVAIALTIGRAAAFAATVGVGYAVNVAADSVKTVATVAVHGTSKRHLANTPAQDQYGCKEYVNPHGQNIPPAGQTPPGTNPRSGQNPDGFYMIGNPGGTDVNVIDLGSGTVFGPYPGGTVIKYTQGKGTTPNEKKIGGNGQSQAVYTHITGNGDFMVVPVGGTTGQTCYVPPPPK